MRRALQIALAVLLTSGAMLSPPAVLAETPVVGGGSYNDAPRLMSGEAYTDTIRPGETLFYGFDLKAGQSAEVTVSSEKEIYEYGDGCMFVGMLSNPLREFVGNVTSVGSPTPEILRTGAAKPISVANRDDDEEDSQSGPGTWYVAIWCSSEGDERDRFTVPYTVTVDVKDEAGGSVAGAPAAAATPALTPTPTPEATAAPTPKRKQAGDGGELPPVGLLGGAIGGGVLLGGLVGTAFKRRR